MTSQHNAAEKWNARYSASDRVWSGKPNALLVREAASLTPGTALDVGAGEGADAIWMAARGWDVTAVDVSDVAINRGRAEAEREGLTIDWRVDDIANIRGQFDLVYAFYPPLPKGSPVLAHLLERVAPGGTLIFVHHVHTHHRQGEGHGFDPNTVVSPADVRAVLDDAWRVDVDEVVEREGAGAASAHFSHDAVLRAVRTGTGG